MIELLFSHYNYWLSFSLVIIGLYIVISHGNLVKKLIGLNIFQVAVFMFFISLGVVEGGTAPIIKEGFETYANPLPHVLILTAIVVGVATTSLGVALVIRIYEAYGTVEEYRAIERDAALEESPGGASPDEPRQVKGDQAT